MTPIVNKYKELSTETINELLDAISHHFGFHKLNDGTVIYDYTKYSDLCSELSVNYQLNRDFFEKEYPSFKKMSYADSMEIMEKYKQHCNPCYAMDIIYILLSELKNRNQQHIIKP